MMATSARDERQLMRQRGAGLRNIENADFDFQVNSQGGRNERQLMRQRGAGNRKVSDIDFGFHFPTPGSSRRKVGQTLENDARRNSRTPGRIAGNHRLSSGTKAVHTKDIEPDEISSKGPRSLEIFEPNENGEQPPTKRRRTNGMFEGTTPVYTHKRRNMSNASFAIAEETDPNQAHEHSDTYPDRDTTSNLPLPANNNKENDETEGITKAEVPKRKKRKSIVQKIGRRKKRSSSVSLQLSSVVPSEVNQATTPVPMQTGPGISATARTISQEPAVEESSINASLASKTGRRKSNRNHKSIILSPELRKSVPADNTALTKLRSSEPQEEGYDSDSVELHEHTDDEQGSELEPSTRSLKSKKGHGRQQRRKRRNDELSIAATSPIREHDEVEGDETYVEEEHTPEPPTPAVTRKSRTKGNQKRNSVKEVKADNRPRGQSFPILTHRMINILALPTVIEEEEDNQEPDQDQKPTYGEFHDRKMPNAVDVLAQICRETVESTLGKLQTQKDMTSGRADMKRKRDALEAFGNDLDQRLFDMSELVEHRLTLEARLRKSQREKADLQARWYALRQQRDELALRADAVRRQNWESEEENTQLWQISELAHRTEIELEQGPPDAVGLEFMLRDIAGSLSTDACGGGLIGKVRAFNTQLESLAASLEGP